VISESSVAAGVRRIEATTGLGVLKLLYEREALLSEVARELKSPSVIQLPKKAESLSAELREAKREIESLSGKIAEMKSQSLINDIRECGKFKLLTATLEMKPDAARALCDTVKAKYADAVVVLAITNDGRLNFVSAAGSEAVKLGAHAGNILKEISVIAGGKGGGRPDSAMSGGRDLDKIPEALAAAEEILKKI
jgi:alanyl-tRNA synthetase